MMDKRGVLINRLQDQYQQGADGTSLLNTALLLVTELQYNQNPEPGFTPGKISVIMPVKPFEVVSNPQTLEEKITLPQEEKVAPEEEQVLPEETNEQSDKILHEIIENNIFPEVDMEPEQPAEAVSQPEPEETEPVQTSAINMLAEEKFNDVFDEIPTLAQQQSKVVYELNNSLQAEEPSVNDRLKPQQNEAGGRLQNEPIKDLRKAIGINDKYTFIKELFRNDEAAYERTLKTINGFSILPEAEYWIQREMKYKLGWDDNNATVKSFYQLVRRRFS